MRPAYTAIRLASPGTNKVGFAKVPSSVTGVTFTNQLSDALALNNQILENGAGVALGDVDGDGRCDVYLCGAENDNRLFRNLGNWKFTNITQAAGVACSGQLSTGAVLADVDGDGDLDLLVNGVGVGTRLFRNDGQGKFTEATNAGLRRNGAATSMALADLDGDGDLDLYVCHYRTTSVRGDAQPPPISARMVKGQLVVTPADRFFGLLRTDGTVEMVEKGEPDVLYWNDGKGNFAAGSWTNGTFLDDRGQPLTAAPEDWGLSVMLRDLDGDGATDIYVCNDFFRSRDRLWLGDGHGHFRAAPSTTLRGFPLSSMAIDVADINRDGHDDFLVAEMLSRDHRTRQHQRANAPKAVQNVPVTDPAYQVEHPRNTLQLARGDGTFADIAWLSGLAATDWTWSVAFLDVDLDGWEDLLVANGNAHDVLDMDAQDAIDRAGPKRPLPVLTYYPRLAQPNLVFRNNGNLTFSEMGDTWGFNTSGVSQGLALGDLDGDGDLDAVVNNLNDETWFYRNEAPAARLAVRLRGKSPNAEGIGARITVTANQSAAKLPVQSQVVVAGGRYLGSDEPLRSFATGGATDLTVEVHWPGGRASRITNALPGHVLEMEEPSGPAVVTAPVIGANTWFTNLSSVLSHRHVENPFDDFARQPLLPNQLSAGGPGVTWFDVNGDGWDDLIVGAAGGDQIALFRNDAHGGFQRVNEAPFDQTLAGDVTTVLGRAESSGNNGLLVGIANYEDGGTNGSAVLNLDPATKASREMVPAWASSVGPLALADVDGDGDLDLFVGGRVIPGRWPEAAASRIFLNHKGRFEPDPENNLRLAQLGLVTGAVFTDLNSDGDPDLVVACEWGPLRIFHNKPGRLTEVNPVVTYPGDSTHSQLSELTGLWNSITAGDFDGDGRMDLLAGNWGLNCREHEFRTELWFGDFAQAGGLDVMEIIVDSAALNKVPWRARDAFVKPMPWLVERYPTLRSFAEVSAEDLLQGRLKGMSQRILATTESLLLLNRGNQWLRIPLPAEAQFAPVFGVAVADFDGDGNEDAFLAQNFFRTELETSRLDAGRGLLLAGDGRGSFRALPGQQSGVLIYGEQRGAAVADFDQDGRPDLVVGQNSGPTQLLRNQSGKPGLRVRLIGPPGNPTGVGARLRLRFGDRLGPVREIHAGAGYWSQDSPMVVLAQPTPPSALEVRWSGGHTDTVPVPLGATFLEARFGGSQPAK